MSVTVQEVLDVLEPVSESQHLTNRLQTLPLCVLLVKLAYGICEKIINANAKMVMFLIILYGIFYPLENLHDCHSR